MVRKQPKNARQRKKAPKHHITFRLTDETLATLNLLVLKSNRVMPGSVELTRTDLLDLIIRYSANASIQDLLEAS